MKKLIFVLCLCLFTIFGIGASASTLDVLNNYLEMQQYYDIMEVKSAPVSTSDAGTEIINGGSGNLIYEANDLTLPGKGGLDLELKRTLNTHVNVGPTGNTQMILVENSAYSSETCVKTYKYIVKYYQQGDSERKPVFVAFDGISHMLEAENSTNSITVAENYSNIYQTATNKTTSIEEKILYSYTIEENTAGFQYGNKFHLYDQISSQTGDVILIRDLTVAPVKIQSDCAAIYGYSNSPEETGYTNGTPWTFDLPRMSYNDYLYMPGDGYSIRKGSGLFYDPENGKSLYFELTYDSIQGVGYSISNMKLFVPSENGSMHKDDVLPSRQYSVDIPVRDIGFDEVFQFHIKRYDGITYTMEGRLKILGSIRIKAKSDAYGNSISYNAGNRDTTIVDSYGRTVKIDKTGITVNGQSYVTYEETIANNDTVDPNGLIDYDNIRRFTVKKADTNGSGVTYGMRMVDDAYTIGAAGEFAPYEQTVPTDTRLLDYVELGTGGRVEYSYVRERDPIPHRRDTVVKRDYRKVAQRGVRQDTTADLAERIQYSYVTRRAAGTAPTRAVTKQFPDRPGYSEYEFYDEKGNLTVSEVSNTEQGDRYFIKTEQEYAYQNEGNYIPIKSTVTTKSGKAGSFANTVVTDYEYNSRQLMTKETRDGEVIAVNAYGAYGVLTEQFQKQSDDTWVGVINTVAKAKITSSKAAKKTDPLDKDVQTFEENTYTYNGYGDLTQSVEQGVTTSYAYTYTNYKALGVFSKSDSLIKTTTVKNVSNLTNADGTGDLVQDISVTERYNLLGLLVKTTDAKGRDTTHEYDGAGRLTKTTYSDGYTSTAIYDDTVNEIITTAEDGIKQKLTYDPIGRNSGGYIFDSQTQEWKKLFDNTYTASGDLWEKRVYHDNGDEKSKIVYTYYPDGQIKSETVLEGGAQLSKKEYVYYPYYKTNKSAVLAKVYLNANAHITATRLMDKYGYRVSDSIIADNAVYTQSYTTDKAGNVLTVKDFKANAENASAPTVTYTYDHANRQVKNTNIGRLYSGNL